MHIADLSKDKHPKRMMRSIDARMYGYVLMMGVVLFFLIFLPATEIIDIYSTQFYVGAAIFFVVILVGGEIWRMGRDNRHDRVKKEIRNLVDIPSDAQLIVHRKGFGESGYLILTPKELLYYDKRTKVLKRIAYPDIQLVAWRFNAVYASVVVYFNDEARAFKLAGNDLNPDIKTNSHKWYKARALQATQNFIHDLKKRGAQNTEEF